MNKKILLTALFLLALGGLLLHIRIHYFMVQDRIDPSVVTFDTTRFFSFLLPMVDLIVVTALFSRKNTAVYGYLLNGLIVIYGTVLMAHFSISVSMANAAPPADWILKSTLPDIAIAWGDFMIGKTLYDMYKQSAE